MTLLHEEFLMRRKIVAVSPVFVELEGVGLEVLLHGCGCSCGGLWWHVRIVDEDFDLLMRHLHGHGGSRHKTRVWRYSLDHWSCRLVQT